MRRTLLPALILACIVVAGCQTDDKGSTDAVTQASPKYRKPATPRYTHVVTTQAAYYLEGPQQSRPPDGTFKTGTKVRQVLSAGSYSLVLDENNVKAYVSKGALKRIGW